MFKIDFKNKRVDFFRLATFAKKNNLNHKECLMQAFNQNVLIEENVVLLKNFINSFENIEQINSQLYQDVFASFIIGENLKRHILNLVQQMVTIYLTLIYSKICLTGKVFCQSPVHNGMNH